MDLECKTIVVGGVAHVFHVRKTVVEKKTRAVFVPVPLDQRVDENTLAVPSLAHVRRVLAVYVVVGAVRVKPRSKEADHFEVTPKCRREAHGDDVHVELGRPRCV